MSAQGQVQKYTRYCNAETLVAAIEAQKKDQPAMHILLSVFKKPLKWVEEKFKRQGLFDAITKITVREGTIEQPLAWIFAISGSFTYYDMPFHLSEFVVFNDWTENAVKYNSKGVYAVLTQQNYQQLVQMQQQRQKQSIKRFIKSHVFYPYYLEDIHAQDFISLMRIKKLKYNSELNWKDQDGSHKIGVVFKGVVSLEYIWKRRLQVAQLTRGMFITNHYIKDQIQQIEEFQLEPIQPKRPKNQQQLPRYHYISKSDDTVLLIFNVRLIREEPYNVNPEILPLIKKNYQKYEHIMNKSINVDEKLKLHRNKSSIKEQIKKKQIRDTFKRNVSLSLSKTGAITSPILRTFHTIQIETSPFETVRTIDIPQPVKPLSKTVFTSISPVNYKHHRSYSSEVPRSLSNRRLVHNTWVEEMSKKKPNVKSFSTLQTLTTYHPERHKKQVQILDEIQKDQKPAFFVPDQFVKKKLRIKYETLVNKVRNMDLTIRKNDELNVMGRMQKLQEYIESKRIVKIGNAKKKFKLLRDRVQY